jgi:hypothetical protein
MAASPAKRTTKKTAKTASSQKGKGQSGARQWKRATAEELELPSGNVALVKRPGMEVFLLEGMIPDTLMPIVTEAVNKGKGIPPAKMQEMVKDPEQVSAMMDAMDRIVCRIVIEPSVRFHKILESDLAPGGDFIESDYAVGEVISEDDRDPDKFIYTDEVFFEDKNFLFQFAVGGTRDLEKFRAESGATLALVQPGEDLAREA